MQEEFPSLPQDISAMRALENKKSPFNRFKMSIEQGCYLFKTCKYNLQVLSETLILSHVSIDLLHYQDGVILGSQRFSYGIIHV